MNLQDILDKYNFQTKKSLGQNFLKEESILDLITQTGEITPEDTILEIGPGLGTLTEKLCQQAKQVIALEKDDTLIPILKERLAKYKNLTILHQDALTFTPNQLISQSANQPTSYKIIANIPYYITSPLINHYLKTQFLPPKNSTKKSQQDPTSPNQQVHPTKRGQSANPPLSLILLTQKEVAEKIATTKKLNVLALNIQTFADPEVIATVPASAFIPAPKVDSAIIKIQVHPTPKVSCDLNKYFQLIHAGFAQKRKTILNSLSRSLTGTPGPKPIPKLSSEELKPILEKANIDPKRRAETLTIAEWETLTNQF